MQIGAGYVGSRLIFGFGSAVALGASALQLSHWLARLRTTDSDNRQRMIRRVIEDAQGAAIRKQKQSARGHGAGD